MNNLQKWLLIVAAWITAISIFIISFKDIHPLLEKLGL